ncbi:MAG: T9SS type A sorting domain-containing protein [Bacteroidota bacterium]
MNGNNIRTVFGNWGVIGQPVDTRPRGTWPKATNGYLGDNSLLIGVEFPIRDYNGDGKPDTIHSVVTSPISRPASSFDTNDKSSGGIPWTFMPVDGFFNPAQTSAAMSNDPSTWPSSWAGSWKGLNGANTTVADLESYFQLDDQNDVRFFYAANNPKGMVYLPDTLNLLRKGAGLRVDVRYLQYTHPLFNDILFRVYDITNESSYDYNKVFAGHLTGTLIGVFGPQYFNEYDDDYSILYKKENVVVAGDFDNNNYRNPFWRGSVGKIGEALLQTSVGESIASYMYFTPSNSISLGDDELLWKQFGPGYHSVPQSIVNDTTVLYGQDGDYTFGSKYFSIPSKGKKRIVTAIAYDYFSPGIFQKIKLGKVLAQKNFNLSNVLSQLSLPAFSFARTLAAVVPIQWPIHNPSGTTEIYFSPDAGATWITIGEGSQDKGEFLWNTATTSDCAFGKLRIFFKDSAGTYNGVMESGTSISVNNNGNGTPFVKIVSGPTEASTVTAATLPLQILAGDPDNKNLTARIYYSVGGNFIKHQELAVVSDTVPQNIALSVAEMPNSTKFKLKIELTDGLVFWSDSTEPFVKNTPRNIAAQSNVKILSGSTQAKITLGIVDKSKTTSDTYIVSFTDTTALKPKTVTVFNATKNITPLDHVDLMPGTEMPIFDGIRLSIDDPGTQKDTAYWSRKDSLPPAITIAPIEILNPSNEEVYGYANPKDYKIIFGAKGITVDLAPYVGYSTPPESVNVNVVEKGSGKPIEFYFDRSIPNIIPFYFVENILGKKRITWFVNIAANNDHEIPRYGDTVTIITKKGISIYDSLQIKNVSLGVEERSSHPEQYSLSQNYPNPFNPTTTIQYGISHAGPVRITVYDLLGREVMTIRQQHQQPGTFSIVVDASHLSSGVYLYQLSATGFSEVKKMTVIK